MRYIWPKKKVGEGQIPPSSTSASNYIYALNELDGAILSCVESSTLQTPLIQMLASTGIVFIDTLNIMSNLGTSWPVQLIQN